MKITKNTLTRSLWTGVEAVLALAITWASSASDWWAAPIALALAGIKTHIIDVWAAHAGAPVDGG